MTSVVLVLFILKVPVPVLELFVVVYSFMSTLNCLNNALSNSDQKSDTWYTGGGGGCGKIIIYISIPIEEECNNVMISSSSFSNNTALTGGGLEIEMDYVMPTSIELNDVTFF